MRNTMIAILAVASSLSLFGCGMNNDPIAPRVIETLPETERCTPELWTIVRDDATRRIYWEDDCGDLRLSLSAKEFALAFESVGDNSEDYQSLIVTPDGSRNLYPIRKIDDETYFWAEYGPDWGISQAIESIDWPVDTTFSVILR